MPRRLLLLSALVLALAPAAHADGSDRDAWLSRAVAAPVSCVGEIPMGATGQALGVHRTEQRTIELVESVCAHLDLLRSGAPRVPRTQIQIARAVFVLAHELAHYDGLADELAADCRALATVRTVAEMLGASPRYARVLEDAAFPFAHPSCTRRTAR